MPSVNGQLRSLIHFQVDLGCSRDDMNSLFYFIITLTILVAVHEYGHFWVARKCGVRVLRFSIGFGPVLLNKRDKHGTDFSFSAIPLGGYVRMLDSADIRETYQSDKIEESKLPKDCFQAQPVWQRMLIVLAGPVANFVLAIFLYWLLYLIGVSGLTPLVGDVEDGSLAAEAGFLSGQTIVSIDEHAMPTRSAVFKALFRRLGETGELKFEVAESKSTLSSEIIIPIEHWLAGDGRPDLLTELGFQFAMPEWPAAVGELVPGGPAELAGVLPNDKIIEIDGHYINSWQQLVDQVAVRPNQAVEIRFKRGAEVRDATVRLGARIVEGKQRGLIGIKVKPQPLPKDWQVNDTENVISAIPRAISETFDTFWLSLESINKMILGNISPLNISGPVGIAKAAGSSANAGLVSFISFMALLSVSLGLINLMPVPMLDGGQFVMLSVEAFRGKPLSQATQIKAQQLGFLLIMSLMVFAIFNDLSSV